MIRAQSARSCTDRGNSRSINQSWQSNWISLGSFFGRFASTRSTTTWRIWRDKIDQFPKPLTSCSGIDARREFFVSQNYNIFSVFQVYSSITQPNKINNNKQWYRHRRVQRESDELFVYGSGHSLWSASGWKTAPRNYGLESHGLLYAR